MLLLKSFFVGTTSEIDLINIGHDVRGFVREAKLEKGTVTVTCPRAGAFLALLSTDGPASTEERERIRKGMAGDAVSFLRPLLPPSVSVPVDGGKMVFEPWRELFLVDFEGMARRREVCVQIVSEGTPVKGRET